MHNQWTTIDQSIFISSYTVRLSNCQSLHLDEDKQNGYHWVRKFRAERQESTWEVVFLYGRQPKNILISWRERRGWKSALSAQCAIVYLLTTAPATASTAKPQQRKRDDITASTFMEHLLTVHKDHCAECHRAHRPKDPHLLAR